jgi:glycosyltransferase involved in cell wall biosynthesis
LIAQTYGIDPAKIFVVYIAVDLDVARTEVTCPPKDESAPYLLMVGASWKHKNAMEMLEEHSRWAPRFRLKILAGAGQYRERLQKRAMELGLAQRVDFIETASEAELADLYRGCSSLVYPSLMEGFGLPPLEAMAHGRPVIVSDIPVFREILGDAPYFVELGNSASWERAFSELPARGSEAELERSRKGIAIASRYTREKMCAALIGALASIWGIALSDGSDQVSEPGQVSDT